MSEHPGQAPENRPAVWHANQEGGGMMRSVIRAELLDMSPLWNSQTSAKRAS
eukprot:CAMPEP_0179130370 /NCGR_PEP_ID=MMETSP0796-20121207/61890_1 /TAXON_ID=73915 /ORGANISM="Pyrodinium bahamense, Strain pbaha01" /LENGTH=51 /DNA_ID=CAMNT_0020829269 /DNA_START=81 /DNA_END=237 /DNA_ORIENTATION=-